MMAALRGGLLADMYRLFDGLVPTYLFPSAYLSILVVFSGQTNEAHEEGAEHPRDTEGALLTRGGAFSEPDSCSAYSYVRVLRVRQVRRSIHGLCVDRSKAGRTDGRGLPFVARSVDGGVGARVCVCGGLRGVREGAHEKGGGQHKHRGVCGWIEVPPRLSETVRLLALTAARRSWKKGPFALASMMLLSA